MIRVVVVDDHPMFREGLRFSLEQADDVSVVAEAADGVEALAAVRRHAPDVVLMDLTMPRLDGLAATARLAGSGARVLVLTLSDGDAAVLAAIRAGARGYLRKGAGPEEVLTAVRSTAAGHAVFGQDLAGRMLALFKQQPSDPRERFPELSAREHDVLEHLARGLSNRQIADVLGLSPVTVRNHVSNILAKLQLANRREAMVRFHDAP